MSEAKYKVGDEVTVTRLRGARCVEAVKEQYYIRDEGWFDSCELTPYVRPIEVGDQVRVRRTGDCRRGTVKIVHGDEACWLADDGSGMWVSMLRNLVRIPTEEAR